jgi:hypothetical protein
MGKKPRTRATRKPPPPRGLPNKSKRTDEPVGTFDSDDDEIDACKITNPSRVRKRLLRFSPGPDALPVPMPTSAVHKQRDVISLDPDDGESPP